MARYAIIMDTQTGRYLSNVTELFEQYVITNYANYVFGMLEDGASGIYQLTWPDYLLGGVYHTVVKDQAGGSPAESDTIVTSNDVYWTAISSDVSILITF